MESGILSRMGIDPAIILLLLFLLIVALFVLYVNVTMKYNRLKSSYNTFMKGKDGKTLEESFREHFSEIEAILKITKQNRLDIREINKRMEGYYQKVGIVKYDAFNEMGGKLSFAIAMLDGNNSGWILNAMHSREGCYTYVKEIVKGESYVELAEEEAEALDKAIFEDGYEEEVDKAVASATGSLKSVKSGPAKNGNQKSANARNTKQTSGKANNGKILNARTSNVRPDMARPEKTRNER